MWKCSCAVALIDAMTHTPAANETCSSLVSIWTFFVFSCSCWFFVRTKSHNEQCDAQMETSAKNQTEQQKSHNEQQKVFACFGFWDRIDSISKIRKSNEE